MRVTKLDGSIKNFTGEELLKKWREYIKYLQSLSDYQLQQEFADSITPEVMSNAAMFVTQDGTILEGNTSATKIHSTPDMAEHNNILLIPFLRKYGFTTNMLFGDLTDKQADLLCHISFRFQDEFGIKHNWMRLNSGTYVDNHIPYVVLPAHPTHNQIQVLNEYLWLLKKDGFKSIEVSVIVGEVYPPMYQDWATYSLDDIDYIMDRVEEYCRQGKLLEHTVTKNTK